MKKIQKASNLKLEAFFYVILRHLIICCYYCIFSKY